MPPLAIGFSFLVLDFYPERMNGVCVNDDKPARTQSEVPYRPQRLKWQKLVGDQKEECDRRPMQDTGAHWQCCSYLIQYLRHFLGFCHVSGGMAVTGDGKASREVMVWGGMPENDQLVTHEVTEACRVQGGYQGTHPVHDSETDSTLNAGSAAH